MELQNKKNTADDFAAEEGTITPLQLLQEIEPLLKEYFIGSFEIKNAALNLHFKNGQNFKLTVCETIKRIRENQ